MCGPVFRRHQFNRLFSQRRNQSPKVVSSSSPLRIPRLLFPIAPLFPSLDRIVSSSFTRLLSQSLIFSSEPFQFVSIAVDLKLLLILFFVLTHESVTDQRATD
jgi:hypothetical protein